MTGRGRLWFCLLLCSATPAFAAGPDFTRDVRPVLARRCFKCHGPDDKTREAGLRLDDRAEAIAAKAIIPGRPDDSEFVKRIVSTDEGEVMPPPHVRAPLTAAEKTCWPCRRPDAPRPSGTGCCGTSC
jgi:hypothetical protein